jgi:hypothetical protein
MAADPVDLRENTSRRLFASDLQAWHACCSILEHVATAMTQIKGQTMKKLTLRWTLPALLAICALGFTASPAFSKHEGKFKSKGSQKSDNNKNNGREAGELPSGIQRRTEKKGTLPSGLQKKKDNNGTLTHGLNDGGKKLDSSTKGKTVSKK